MNDTQNSRSAEQRSARYLMSNGQLHNVPELDSARFGAGAKRVRAVLDRTAADWKQGKHALSDSWMRPARGGEQQ